MKPTVSPPAHKRPVNLLLSSEVVRDARMFTSNLSSTVDALLAEYVAKQHEISGSRQQMGDAVADLWNRFGEKNGSFADEYSTL